MQIRSLNSSKRYCLAGVDDGYFERDWRNTVIALAVHCWVNDLLIPVDIYLDIISVDGVDSTRTITSLVKRAMSNYNLKAVFMDTIIYAGFNVANPFVINDEVGVPLVIVHSYRPDLEAIGRALRKHFRDWKERLAPILMTASMLTVYECPRGTIYAASIGLDRGTVWDLLCRAQVYTRVPEPLYTANKVASRLSRALKARLKNPG